MIFVAFSLHPASKYLSFNTEIYVITPQFEVFLNDFLGLVPVLKYSKVAVGIKNKIYIDREVNFPNCADGVINNWVKSIGNVFNVKEEIAYQIIESRAAKNLKCESCRAHRHYSWNCARSLAYELKNYCNGIQGNLDEEVTDIIQSIKNLFYPPPPSAIPICQIYCMSVSRHYLDFLTTREVLEIFLISADWSEKFDSWIGVEFILSLMPKVIALKSAKFEICEKEDKILIQQIALKRVVFVEDVVGIDCRFPDLRIYKSAETGNRCESCKIYGIPPRECSVNLGHQLVGLVKECNVTLEEVANSSTLLESACTRYDPFGF